MTQPNRVDSGTEKLTGRIEAPIGWLTFNNPERRNAVSLEMWEAIPRVLDAFEADPSVRVVVITGAGGQSFVAGADISQFETARATAEANERYKAVSGKGHGALARLRKPSIAMIDGFCIGGGLAVALACDLRVASDRSRFGIPAARLGLGYNFPGVQKLVQLVGPGVAREILFTAERFPAETALRMGLINRVTAPQDLDAEVRKLAETIAANAPLTIRAAKLAIEQSLKDPGERDLAAVEAAVKTCFDSEDYAEGRRAFLEKRTPRFQGR
ncbi:enoyl-CoA hydratase [Phenylobacterium sp. VNQ135]|uniref:enoyl-CoA hydratase n=1 Tax=Phenylobacterium sp. VNQ135 TaxID=3400922 RepID=UPI003C10CB1A